MLSQNKIAELRSDYLDSLTTLLQTSLEGMNKSFELSLNMARNHLLYPYALTLALTDGQTPPPVTDVIEDGVRSSTHLITDHYAQMVHLLESHLHVLNKGAHHSLDRIQYWSPPGVESALGQVDSLLEAAETSTDQFADASVDLARVIEQQLGTPGTQAA